jgi:hypothetical protein
MKPYTYQKRQYKVAKHYTTEQQEVEQHITVTVDRGALHRVAVKINIVRPVCSLMFGKHHCTATRLIAGVVIAATGVVVAKYFGHSHDPIISYVGDGIGYGLHGLGLTPFIEYLAAGAE